MEVKTVKIETIKQDQNNARIHDDKNIEFIKVSLEKFGQQKPIVINKDNVVVAGNGTLIAAKSLGWKKIDIVETELTGIDLTAYAIADNRTSELAIWDEEILNNTLELLQSDTSFDESVSGFSTKQITDMIDRFNKEPDITGAIELSEKDFKDFNNKCPKCGFEFND